MKAETLNSIDLKAVPDSAWAHLCAAAILESMQAKKAPPAATGEKGKARKEKK